MSMLAKLNKITSWQAAIIIAIMGFSVFFVGLTNPFIGDDLTQIVSNPVVHSISNISRFFEGGTFYNGQGFGPQLYGAYFRPLMTTTYSLLYSLFGPRPLYFHLFQLLLYIGSAIILYLFFRYSFKPVLALTLSIIFLVHPLNSQVAFAIPAMQDALFFFFGILALYLLLRLKSIKSLILVSICLLISLLSKETGVLFIAICLIYLFLFEYRKRLYAFIGIVALPIALWLTLKIHAIGLLGANPHNAPIDSLSLSSRLLTAPSIVLSCITKFIFPWKLASAYYWTNPTFSLRHVLIPLLIDIAVLAIFVYFAFIIYRQDAKKTQFYTYIFFFGWLSLGMLTTLQIIPLDMTTCDSWFYFPMAGLLGMLGIILTNYKHHFRARWLILLAITWIVILSVTTIFRGFEWRSVISLAENNIAVSESDDYVAYDNTAINYYNQKDYTHAEIYAKKSIAIFPDSNSYYTLGHIYEMLGDYPDAVKAYTAGLKFNSSIQVQLYDRLGALTVVNGSNATNKQLLVGALNKLPGDANLWFYLAILEYHQDNISNAQYEIRQAYLYEPSDSTISKYYYKIMHGLPI